MSEAKIVTFPMKRSGDPIYFSEDVTSVMQKTGCRDVSDGIYPGDNTYLQVLSNDNMTVTVKPGYANVQGIQVWVKEDVVLPIDAADSERIDRVVLRLSITGQEVLITVKKEDTTLTRIPGQVWELGLADITVANGATVITQENITDLRQDKTVCGFISAFLTVDGEYDALNTNNKKVIGAINEIMGNQDDFLRIDGEYSNLTTMDKKIIGAINEVNSFSENLLSYLNDGWVPVSESFSLSSSQPNVSIYSITVPSGALSRWQTGDKIKFMQDNVTKYERVLSVTDTILSVEGDPVTSSAITNIFMSHALEPKGMIAKPLAKTITTWAHPSLGSVGAAKSSVAWEDAAGNVHINLYWNSTGADMYVGNGGIICSIVGLGVTRPSVELAFGGMGSTTTTNSVNCQYRMCTNGEIKVYTPGGVVLVNGWCYINYPRGI